MPAIVIIPSRYGSTRFQGKPLSLLLGKPMIQHVYERSKKAVLVNDVFVATDSEQIYEAVEGFGGKAIITSEKHRSGTDRIAEAVEKLQGSKACPRMSLSGVKGQGIGYKMQDIDIIVNVQGDEPMIYPQMIDDVIRLMDDERTSIGTLVKRIEKLEEITDPNVVKAVFGEDGFALYFSRSPIPYHRDSNELLVTSNKLKEKNISESSLLVTRYFFKHIGIYAYRKHVLLSLAKRLPSRLEEIEKLEQLRALENGFKIKVKETPYETIGVDTPLDLERVEQKGIV